MYVAFERIIRMHKHGFSWIKPVSFWECRVLFMNNAVKSRRQIRPGDITGRGAPVPTVTLCTAYSVPGLAWVLRARYTHLMNVLAQIFGFELRVLVTLTSFQWIYNIWLITAEALTFNNGSKCYCQVLARVFIRNLLFIETTSYLCNYMIIFLPKKWFAILIDFFTMPFQTLHVCRIILGITNSRCIFITNSDDTSLWLPLTRK